MNGQKEIKCILNKEARNNNKKASIDFISKEVVQDVIKFHKSFPEYKETPLQKLNNLANELNLCKIWVKDESYRFGLNAFKVLGGSYALAKYLSLKLNIPTDKISFEKLRSKEIKDKLGDITFVTATDGNHGRGIAWAASKLGQKSVVYMPKGSSNIRLENIKKEGAKAYITDFNYDGTVRLANENAKKNGWVMVQDTAWEGYEDIPIWIMQGYTTIIHEAINQIVADGCIKPTHVFLQAGVGSFAGAIQGYLACEFGSKRPLTIIVEPDDAACIYKSVNIGDGKPHSVTGDMPTIMAGLACGEPNTIGWNILRDYSDAYISCPDYVAAKGMRILGNPIKGDPKVISGESGAVGLGLISFFTDKKYMSLRNKLNLNKESKILIISTEGDTDPINYRKIVWDGKYASV